MPGRPDDPQVAACLEHAVFGKPEESAYVLPYPVGREFEVFQTYCGPVSHGKDDQMSIDFLMPVGSEIVASRAGTVRYVTDGHEDYGRGINYIYIEHQDHSAAFYALETAKRQSAGRGRSRGGTGDRTERRLRDPSGAPALRRGSHVSRA